MIDNLAKKIAGQIDIPFVPEIGEVKAVEMALDSLYPVLDKVLPDSWVDTIQDLADGIDEAEAASYKARLKREIDEEISLPDSLEWLDDIFIDAIVDALGTALVRGFSL